MNPTDPLALPTDTHRFVIFDCDGVLVDSEPIVNRVEAEFLSEKGWTLDASEARATFKGRSIQDVVALVTARIDMSPVDWHELAFRTAHALSSDLRPIAGIVELLDSLESREVSMCVASQSSWPRVQLSLKACGLTKYFANRVYTASMVARPKPAPDLFLYAARQLGADPSACIVIEDSASGVEGAVAAGMTVLGYAADESALRLDAAGAKTFTRMSDVPQLLGIA
jgi:HAD superfamily hydrolase (TIGR01509 family)